jgi:hypothetical protein
MHEYTDTEWRRQFNPVSGSSLTVGTLAKIADAASEALAKIADLNRRLDRLEREKAVAALPRLILEAAK